MQIGNRLMFDVSFKSKSPVPELIKLVEERMG